MKPPHFQIRAWSAWAPGRETEAAWRAWAGQPALGSDQEPDPAPLLLRRRVGALGRNALRAAWSLPESATARMVFCSRHGEYGRTLSILDSLAALAEVSPADFTLSVHNALAGLFSIARANREGHTTIAAGAESFGFGMMEAIACLAERPEQPVIVVYFDEPLPAPYDLPQPDVTEPLALAFVLSAGEGTPFTLSTRPSANAPIAPEPGTPEPGYPEPGSLEPGAIAFMRCMLGAAPDAVVAGEQLVWHWRREDAAN